MNSNNERLIHPAGQFSAWLKQTREAQLEPRDIDVACGDCTACCTSSYFIHVRPDDKAAISHIPKELLFPAPGLPKGNMVLGFDENGHCPMLVNNRCSIYEFRPQTCRTYDCRLFTAVGIPAGGADKSLINQKAHEWEFDYPSLRDFTEQQAVKSALSFLQKNKTLFPEGVVPDHPTPLALMAIKIYFIFLTESHSDQQRVTDIMTELKIFEEKSGH
jgi:hypothetical protein